MWQVTYLNILCLCVNPQQLSPFAPAIYITTWHPTMRHRHQPLFTGIKIGLKVLCLITDEPCDGCIIDLHFLFLDAGAGSVGECFLVIRVWFCIPFIWKLDFSVSDWKNQKLLFRAPDSRGWGTSHPPKSAKKKKLITFLPGSLGNVMEVSSGWASLPEINTPCVIGLLQIFHWGKVDI